MNKVLRTRFNLREEVFVPLGRSVGRGSRWRQRMGSGGGKLSWTGCGYGNWLLELAIDVWFTKIANALS